MKRKICSLPYTPAYLSKAECLRQAEILRHTGALERLTKKEIAREIYSHAVIYRVCETLKKRHIHLRSLMEKADPIDISDAGDTLLRRICFHIVWMFPGRLHE